MKTLEECLADHDTTFLRAIAERHGIELTTHQRPQMIQQVAAALRSPEVLTEALTWLDDRERQVLDLLLVNKGRMRAHRLTQRFGPIRRFGPGSLAREAPWRHPTSPLEGLWYRGLIARSFAQEMGTTVEFIFVPSDLLPLFPVPHVDESSFTVTQAQEPDAVSLGDPALADDLCTLLSAVQAGELHAQRGDLEPGAADRVLVQFLNRERPRLSFLYHLALLTQLVRHEGRALRLNREPVREWLKRPRAEQLLVLQKTWYNDPGWKDLWHVPGIHCEETGWRSDPIGARQAVLKLVRRGWSDAWLSIPAFVDTVHEQFPDYLRPDGDFESWYIRDVRSGEYLTGFEHWDRVEGALLVYLLSGPLHWLGMISLGYREGWEKPTAFRVTPWGLAFLDMPHASLEALPPQPARIAPEGTVMVDRNASLHDRFQLSRIADWRDSGSEYVYAITPASLGRAFGSGIQIDMIERFLQRISEDSIPAAAVARLRSWASRYGQVRIQHVAILETSTPQILRQLRAHERIRGYLRQTLSPTTVLIREVDWSRLIDELYRAGFLPEIIKH